MPAAKDVADDREHMMNFDNDNSVRQYRDGNIWVSGYAFLGHDYRAGKSLADIFIENNISDYDAFKAQIKYLNGNFAVVAKNGDVYFAAVDKVRSIPLFYAIKEGGFYISNSAKQISENLKGRSVNESAVNEFYCAGYVTGKETLLTDIKQLEAGESLIYDPGNAKNPLITERYYRYISENITDESEGVLMDKLDDALDEVFKRLAKSAEGRTFVVPLSGGLDSRLLVSMLKKTGHDNVICFSYGRRGNHESKKSKHVADKMGFKWIFIEYSFSKWRRWRKSKEFGRYFNFADNFASLPHIDDWAAAGEMKCLKLIPEDSIFVPGHTGDFISGGHLNYIFNLRDTPVKNDLIDGIVQKHYGLWPERLKNKSTASGIYKKVRDLLPEKNDGAQEIASNYEYWEWQERQAKFVINSVRVYDFWGFEWRLPFWDQDVMDFWKAIPYGLKLDKKLYIKYLTRFDPYGLFEPAYRKKPHAIAQRALYKNYKKIKEYVSGPKATYGLYDPLTVLFNLARIRNPNSLLAKDYIDNFIDIMQG